MTATPKLNISRAYSGPAAGETVTSAGTPIDVPTASHVPLEPETASLKQDYRLKSGIILTRAPLLTAQPTTFEESFYFYQKRLNERTSMPFVTKVYFKPDTPAMIDWNLKVADRKGTVAKELGVYHGKASQGWDDELKVGDERSGHANVYGSLLKDAEMRVSDDAEVIPEEDRVPAEKPAERISEADRKGDAKRLDRAMDKTLYLVVKGKDGQWGFPSAPLSTEQNLHEVSGGCMLCFASYALAPSAKQVLTICTQAAQTILDKSAGVDMNTWIVGRVPVAHHVVKPQYDEGGAVAQRGEKTFFLKGRIMAGQAKLDGNPYGYTDFKWLTREELKDELESPYYHSVRNMMADR